MSGPPSFVELFDEQINGVSRRVALGEGLSPAAPLQCREREKEARREKERPGERKRGQADTGPPHWPREERGRSCSLTGERKGSLCESLEPQSPSEREYQPHDITPVRGHLHRPGAQLQVAPRGAFGLLDLCSVAKKCSPLCFYIFFFFFVLNTRLVTILQILNNG